jgi:hypothetical protein
VSCGWRFGLCDDAAGWATTNDLDLHCQTPTGSHIFYGNRAPPQFHDKNRSSDWDSPTFLRRSWLTSVCACVWRQARAPAGGRSTWT